MSLVVACWYGVAVCSVFDCGFGGLLIVLFSLLVAWEVCCLLI